MKNPNPDPAQHKNIPVWNAENWMYEDIEIGSRIRSIRRTISEGESMQFNALVLDMPEWAEVGGSIQRTFGFPNFVAAMEFVNKVAAAAEADQHHPDILIRYNKVTMSLNTHDAGGITAKDFALAAKMDAMVAG